jgi:hypothetical protein
MIRRLIAVTAALCAVALSTRAEQQTVRLQQVDDRKAIIATVEPVREILA